MRKEILELAEKTLEFNSWGYGSFRFENKTYITKKFLDKTLVQKTLVQVITTSDMAAIKQLVDYKGYVSLKNLSAVEEIVFQMADLEFDYEMYGE